MLTILHNPRCSKSRKWLELLKKTNKEFQIREYLKEPLSLEELKDLQKKLWLKVIEFTRTKEKEFKELWLTKNSTNDELLQAIVKVPKLLERPIIYNEKKAVLWRPEPEEKFNIFLIFYKHRLTPIL